MTNPVPRKPLGRRKWLFRFLAVFGVPALLFGLLEVGLRAGNYGHNPHFFLDGSENERSGTSIDNPNFNKWIFPPGFEKTPFPVPFVLPDEKPAGTYRVFVLGESAAMGFPDPSSSFVRCLEALLKARYPDTKFEVVNAAIVAINSHVVLPIARECAGKKPDLFVVHVGNNEVVGPYGIAGVLGPFSPSLGTIRLNLGLKGFRTGQLLDSTIRGISGSSSEPQKWEGMKMFVGSQVRADDERLERVYDHYRRNLKDICETGTGAGIPVVLCTIPSNLKESAPFASMHKPDFSEGQLKEWDIAYNEGIALETAGKPAEALAKYEAAAALDDAYADLIFHQARCLSALNKPAEAKGKYELARDKDALRFRTDSRMNGIVRELAKELNPTGVRLADAEQSFAAASPGNIPGENLFLEHVHMNYFGNYRLAHTVFQTIVNEVPKEKLPASAASTAEPLTEKECADRLAITEWSRLKIATQVRSEMFKMPPFTTQLDQTERLKRWDDQLKAERAALKAEGLTRHLAIYKQAVEANGQDWMLRANYALLLTEAGDATFAETQYREGLKLIRHGYPLYVKLGMLRLQAGKPGEAATQFKEAVRIAPENVEAHYGLAEVLAAQGKTDEAVAKYEEQFAREPDRGKVLAAIGTMLFRANRLSDAKVRLNEALPLEPDNTTVRTYLGDIAMKQGNPAEALEHYEAALKIRPDWPEMLEHVARVKGLKK